MLGKIYYMISIISIIIFLSANEEVYANPQNPPPSFEEKYTQIGYKSVEESIKEFENFFKGDVNLPKITPSISFTHKYGRFYEDKNFDTNDFLEIQFVNKNFNEHNYKIDIRPLENKLTFKGKTNQEEYTLQNGTKAIYFEDQIFNFLVLEKNNLQYMLGINKKVSNKVTVDELIQIANSID